MRTVSASDAKRRFAAMLEVAQGEPVVIRRRTRDIAVLLSVDEYQRLRAADAARRPAAPPAGGGLTDAELADIVAEDDGG